ncbi:MAG TPA: FAD-binding oxidoreductase, partial [Candidatus Dormibacteraeota bacterium]|nr:FAD-binding oxidoreductase [Candidatus Dormibacteraeota bacterium]
MTTRAPEATLLAELVGPAAVRPGGPGDAIGELLPSLVVRPRTAAEVAAVLRAAADGGWAVVPRGGGTSLLWGARLRRCDVVLDTTGLDALVEHAPADLICVAGAGMRLGALQAVVGGAPGFHQRLMLDPPQGEDATLGGLVATRASGPLRQRYGTMRDLLIGAQFVLADGTVARTGGKVVK